MTRDMSQPIRIEDISLDDLKKHRWCYYYNDELGYDAFEYVIPNTHPEFCSETIELELAEFIFANGKRQFGIFDGSESFSVVINNDSLSFWRGMMEPADTDIKSSSLFLKVHDLAMPVQVTSKWTKQTRVFEGLEYINQSNEVVSVVI